LALEVFYSGRAALETVRGTSLTPTRIIYFEQATETQDVATIRPQEHRASYSPVYSASAGPEHSRLNFQGRLTYDDAPWWLNLFMAPKLTPTGAGPYVYTFLPNPTADDVKTATIELAYADTIGTAPGFRYNGCFGSKLNLKFAKNADGAVTYNADLFVQKPATAITAFTGSLSDRTGLTPMSANNTTVYIDTSTIGTTADPLVTEVDWSVDLGPVPFYTLDGTVAANAIYRPNYRTWSAKITRQYNSATATTAYKAQTTEKIRVKATTGASAIFQLDLYGTYTERRTGSVDGIITEELTLEPIWDATSTSDHNAVVTNSVASIS
jgi:hypothetical protein